MNDEYNRLKAVNRFISLNSSTSRDLAGIAELTARLCDAPVALITLLGKDTQWFKARKGVDMESTPRQIAFCNHTIKKRDVVVVPDMKLDVRYSSNPLVSGDPNARFYAGCPLITDDGYAVGSLCVVGFEPRELDVDEKNTLRMLARQAINLMQLDSNLRELELHHKNSLQNSMDLMDSELKLKAIFDSSSDQHVLVDRGMRIMAMNKATVSALHSVLNIIPEIGTHLFEYVDQHTGIELRQLVNQAFGGRSIKRELLVWRGTPHEGWREVKLVPIRNIINEVVGVAINAVDITHNKLQEEQIRVQNEALTRIAIIQSHELRRPVASLLGLLHVMKLEQDKMGIEEYMEMMQLVVDELDQKIKLIVKDSEDTINSNLSIVA